MGKRVLFLIGFMGEGKTSIGEVLAKKMGFFFIDSDKYVEKKEKMSIIKIFKIHGEEYFRKLEKKAINEICDQLNEPAVVSLGAGAVSDRDTVNSMKRIGHIIHIDADFDTLYARLTHTHDRPLAINKSKRCLERLYYERKGDYETIADYTYQNLSESVEETTQKIYNEMRCDDERI
jgi:shikimate kinase